MNRVRRCTSAQVRLVTLLDTLRWGTVGFVDGDVAVVEAAGSLGLDEESPNQVGKESNDNDATNDTTCYRTGTRTVVTFACAVVASSASGAIAGTGDSAEGFRALGAALCGEAATLSGRACWANELFARAAADTVVLTDDKFGGVVEKRQISRRRHVACHVRHVSRHRCWYVV